ncbi:hypothetical protein KEM54_001226, partial [Ascosphaera aggregata]
SNVEDATTRRRSFSEPRPAISTSLFTTKNLRHVQQLPQQVPSLHLVRETSELGTSASSGYNRKQHVASDLSTVLEHMQPGEEQTSIFRVKTTSGCDDSQRPPQSSQNEDIMIVSGAPAPAPAPAPESSLQVPEPAVSQNRLLPSLRRTRASTVSGSLYHSDFPGRISRRSSRAGMSDSGWRQPHEEVDGGVVNLLDAIDPEISTLTTLTNVQNSLFIPHLGSFLNRRPTYVISRSSSSDEESGISSPFGTSDHIEGEVRVSDEFLTQAISERRLGEEGERIEPKRITEEGKSDMIELRRTRTEYMILPDGVSVDGWTEAERAQLNDHVRHMLHSKRSKFRRGLKGLLQYISRPLGFLVTLYAVLITLFGLAWVLFLIGWINVGGRQLYIINVIDNVLVALFAIMGDGLAPFRAVDTYHMIFIAHYGHLTWKRRKQRHLRKLKNKNDLPTAHGEHLTNLDAAPTDLSETAEQELSVLSIRQQERLVHHQDKFARSHTFYKPHETGTHYAFPLNLLIAIVVLLDFHSCFQIALGICTWSIYYKRRPFALTTVILCCSIACNITAGILIWVGDRRTRKVEVITRMFRQELTSEAMKKMEKKKRKVERKVEKEERKSLTLSRLGGRSSAGTSPRLPGVFTRKSSRSRRRVSGNSGSESDSFEREESPTSMSIQEALVKPSPDRASRSIIGVSPCLRE